MHTRRDEGRHPAGRQSLWGESWFFDFAASDGSLGGYVLLGLFPNQRVAWYWAYVVGDGRPLIAVRDQKVDLPRAADLEVRGEGLWSLLTCETPDDHWSIGLEAFAVALDSPLDAYRGEFGRRVGLGFDLEWEAVGPAVEKTGATCYEQSGLVHGDILVGDERLAFDGPGHRSHGWGIQDWWGARPAPEATSRARRWWMAGRLSDGTSFGMADHGGYFIGGDGVAVAEPVSEETTFDTEGFPVLATVTAGGRSLAVEPLHHGPVLLEAPDGRQSRLARALCRFRTTEGHHGVGWAGWLHPPL
jgi:hypothetical protein